MSGSHPAIMFGQFLLFAMLGVAPVSSSAESPTPRAERLLQLARDNRLTDPLAAQAAELLSHEDPFVRAIAEWAIATKVDNENKGQQSAWPRPSAPPWFVRWQGLDTECLLECDYARQAVVWDTHHDGKKLLGSLGKILRRAQGAALEIRTATESEETRSMVVRQLDQLHAIHKALQRQVAENPHDIVGHRRLWLEARHATRPIVLANPAVDFDGVLFITRHSAHSHRNITGSQYPWVHKPGGDICVRMGLDPNGRVRPVLQGKLGPGHVHGIDLHWDADRVIFGFASQKRWPPKWDTVRGNDVFRLREDQEPTHLYEIHLDGTGLRQRTDHGYFSDFEPTYCANGGIVFASDRSGRSSECGKFTADHTAINLHRISPDGTALRRLNDNKDIDRYPHALDNGLIAYTRWDYQERHFLEVHAVWTVHPDGTMADAVFNQHIKAPYGLRDTRSIPGSQKLVSIATGHHTLAYGPVVIIDPSVGINNAEALKIVTPHVRPQEGPMAGLTVPEGGVPDRGGLYQTPWALSERCFLVSYSYAPVPSPTGGGSNAAGFAIYLIDVHGNKELIHRERIYSSAFPMPLRKRPRPPIVTELTDRADSSATCYVADVYDGLDGIPRGAVKYIRVSQRVGWPLDDKIGAMRWIPGNAWERHFGFWSWSPVRVIGSVPVEEDGSAHFKVPAEEALYFQALDENHMELRRMRSHVTFQPGEVRGCTGCHESQLRSPQHAWRLPKALSREPREPAPPDWGADRLLGYEWLIQPVLDRRCVRCHGGQKTEGGIDLTATKSEDGFRRSFGTLFGRPIGPGKSGGPGKVFVSVSDRFSGASVTQPKQFGSHRSPLIALLRKDPLHKTEAALSQSEWIALVTWIDANAPYYDTFFNRRPEDGGPPRRERR